MNYINLPKYVRDFVIKHDNLSELVPIINGHSGVFYPTTKFITTEGVEWFNNHGIQLRPNCLLFRARCNTTGIAHIDGTKLDLDSQLIPHLCAFNFVLEGHGEMQWVEVDKYISDGEFKTQVPSTQVIASVPIVTQEPGSEITVLDTWTGDTGFVRIETFHRVVTSDVDRVCLSVRACFPLPFDEAAKQVSEIFQLK
jgi:hypothetical protein